MTEDEKLAALDHASREYLRLKQWDTAMEQIHHLPHNDHSTDECWVDLWAKRGIDEYWVVAGKWIDGKRESYTMSRVSLWINSDKPWDYHNEDGEPMDACHNTAVCIPLRGCINPDHLYWDTRAENLRRRALFKRKKKHKRAHKKAPR